MRIYQFKYKTDFSCIYLNWHLWQFTVQCSIIKYVEYAAHNSAADEMKFKVLQTKFGFYGHLFSYEYRHQDEKNKNAHK